MTAETDTRTATLDDIRAMERRGELEADDETKAFDVPAAFWNRARPAAPRARTSVHRRRDPDVRD